MRVLFDTNVLLDVILKRAPFFESSTRVLELAAGGRVEGLACAISVTTVWYVTVKNIGREGTRCVLMDLLSFLETAPVDHAMLLTALAAQGHDFEDDVIAEAAKAAKADVILTRDESGFANCGLLVRAPEVYLRESFLSSR